VRIPSLLAVAGAAALITGALTAAFAVGGQASAAAPGALPAGVSVHGDLTYQPRSRTPHYLLPHPVLVSKLSYRSDNWSGYVALSSSRHVKMTGVSATFTVPSLKCDMGGAWAAEWVGLDGFNTGTVEQEGVEAVCQTAASTATYMAFYEMYPAAQVAFSGINAGDAITVSTGEYRNGTYHLAMTDITNGSGFSVTRACPAKSSCKSESAEIILEAPTSDGSLDPLADFGIATFVNSRVAADFAPKTAFVSGRSFSVGAIDMVGSGGGLLASVGPLEGGEDFSDTWKNS
jgi:Peptidase A4 family